MKFVALMVTAMIASACGPVSDSKEGWREPTEVAIETWNLAHPATQLSAKCEDRVRGVQFELATQDHIDRECPPTQGITSQGCTVQYDAHGSIALILDSEATAWRIYAHEALHVAHMCAEGNLDPHHQDHALWAHDPSDALHI